MKKIVLSVLFLLTTALVIAQQVPRSMVAVEIGTGTWCTYCPGAAMGADDLLENGKKVAVIENHNGDPYANVYSNARNSYYNITGYPTAFFDGLLSVVGGSHSQSMYTQYLPKYNQRIAALASLTLSMDVTHSGLNYTAVITINKVANITPTDLKLRFFVTQSNIQQNWQGQTHLEHVNRLMVPDQNGTAISFVSGDTQVVTLNFTMNVAWPVADCEFIALVQSQATKETFNCIKQGTINLTPDFTAFPVTIGAGESVTFTNTTIGGYIGVPEETFLWSFPGGTPGTSTLENPVVTYADCGGYDVTLTVDRGGQVESITKTQFITVGAAVNIAATPNDTVCTSQSITLDATSPDIISYLWMPGGQTTPIITVDTTGTGGGAHEYSVTAIATGGCQITKAITVYFDNCGTAFMADGTITYPNNASTPLSGITINLKNVNGTIIGTTTTNPLGSYAFNDLFNGDYSLEALTSSAWGGVTAADVLLFKKHIANISLLNGIFLASGEVNGSGGLTAADVLLIKKRVANIISSFPVGDWLYNNIPFTVNGSNVTQNFNGLCYGDANASFVPAGNDFNTGGQIKSLTGSLTMGTLYDVQAGEITLPVRAADLNNLGSFQFTIEYNPDLLTFNSVSGWITGIDGVTYGEPVPGKITFVWAADDAGITISDDLFFNLNFTWKGNTATSQINWSDIPTQREFGDYTGNIFEPAYNNGSIAGSPVGLQENELQTIKVYPNPASSMVDVRSDVAIRRIELISFIGQPIYTQTDLETKSVRFNVSDLQSGVYFVKATTDNGIKTVKITVTH